MFKVIDELTGETLTFKNSFDAQVEAERRLNIHKTGYSIRRNYVQPVDAKIIKEGKVYRICLN